ncbi:MAG: 6-carboxytetrahydropterin synthase [Bacteroidales bacterium]|nr:6-carboxytetrahydropterin synthase [Bacteroidales bacterium]
MAIVRLTKRFGFEMAHALHGYDGLCAHLHGHSYYLTTTVIGEVLQNPTSPKNGMVMDFGDLKKIVYEEIVDRCDHALMLNKSQQEEIVIEKEQSKLFQRVIFVDYQPTSENMLIDFASRIKRRLPQHIKLHHLILHETNNSSAEWWEDDN